MSIIKRLEQQAFELAALEAAQKPWDQVDQDDVEAIHGELDQAMSLLDQNYDLFTIAVALQELAKVYRHAHAEWVAEVNGNDA